MYMVNNSMCFYTTGFASSHSHTLTHTHTHTFIQLQGATSSSGAVWGSTLGHVNCRIWYQTRYFLITEHPLNHLSHRYPSVLKCVKVHQNNI